MTPSDPDLKFGEPRQQSASQRKFARRALIVRRHRRLMLEELRALEGAVEE
jgi:hypothetical protein